MRLSAKAQYALVAMVELAGGNPSQPLLVQVKTIADTHGISQRFLVQILLQLKVHGLVKSVRGAAGGYQLAQRPDRVSLADIIHAIDEPGSPSSPALAALAASPAVQAVSGTLRDLEAREREMLRELKLSDLVQRAEKADAMSYQI
jgi:Rrf2 family transcriptional regulator, cysteine metabolism repressor